MEYPGCELHGDHHGRPIFDEDERSRFVLMCPVENTLQDLINSKCIAISLLPSDHLLSKAHTTCRG